MMMRAVLNGLKKADPQAQLAFLAYEKDLSLPSAEIPEDIFLEFAPIKRNHELPLTADCEINSGFKNQLSAPDGDVRRGQFSYPGILFGRIDVCELETGKRIRA